MKKLISMMSLALMCMLSAGVITSCSQEEEASSAQSETSHVIRFNATTDNAAGTRGLPTTSTNYLTQVKDFKVWGTVNGRQYIGNTDFYDDNHYPDETKAGVLIANKGGGKWDYNTATDMVYWPNEAMKFYAITPSTNANYSYTSSNGNFCYTVPTDNSQQIDLMHAYAANQTKTTNKGVVNLQFQHALSQVVFKAITKSSNLNVEIQSIKIHNVQSKLYVSLISDWSFLQSYSPYANYSLGMGGTKTVAVTDASNAVNLTTADGALMLAPQTLSGWTDKTSTTAVDAAHQCYIEIVCKITSKTSSGTVYLLGSPTAYDSTYFPLSGTWEAGKRYVYTLQFGGGKDADGNDRFSPISFSVKVSDWADSSSNVSM